MQDGRRIEEIIEEDGFEEKDLRSFKCSVGRVMKNLKQARAKAAIAKHPDGSMTVVPLELLHPGMIEFMLTGDNRPRNGNGQFVANETEGMDPNSMAAAYGGVEAEKAARRQGLIARMREMLKSGKFAAGDGGVWAGGYGVEVVARQEKHIAD